MPERKGLGKVELDAAKIVGEKTERFFTDHLRHGRASFRNRTRNGSDGVAVASERNRPADGFFVASALKRNLKRKRYGSSAGKIRPDGRRGGSHHGVRISNNPL